MRLFGLLILLLALAGQVAAREVPIADFFKEPEFRSIRLSPDGRHIAVTVPEADRTVLAVLRVEDLGVVGRWDYGQNHHFERVEWANPGRLLMWVSVKQDSKDFRVAQADLYASNIDGTGRIGIRDGNYYDLVSLTPDDPDTILVQRTIDATVLFKLNINNGNTTFVATAPWTVAGSFILDGDEQPQYLYGDDQQGRNVTYARNGSKWEMIHQSERGGATFTPLGITADGTGAYFAKGQGGEPDVIVRVDRASGQQARISANGTVPPSIYAYAPPRGLLWTHGGSKLIAARYDAGIPYWDFLEPSEAASKVYAGLVKAFPEHMLDFINDSDDGRFILFWARSDVDPGQAYLFDRQTGKASFLLSNMQWIKPEEMSPMKPVDFKARDGMALHGYLTLPREGGGKDLPLIVNPHGGPHGIRDFWEFNDEVQFLANRGYAVLQLNYRGSGGYGNAYEKAGYRKWGTAMQDDLTDAVAALVRAGTVDRDRICIYGASYGGYAALMSSVREPDLYKCAVGYVGVYDLDIQRDADFADHAYGRNYLRDVYPQDKAERMAQSPAYGVDRLKAAVMLVHGKKDVRVPIRNMDVLIERMAQVGKKPELVIVEKKEQHGFHNEENKVALYGQMLPFFDKYIGRGAHGAPAGSP